MTDIVLSTADRELCDLAAQLLMSVADPGQEREDATERIIQRYRDRFTATYAGADPAALDDMALNFTVALLLAMERVGLAHATEAEAGHA